MAYNRRVRGSSSSSAAHGVDAEITGAITAAVETDDATWRTEPPWRKRKLTELTELKAQSKARVRPTSKPLTVYDRAKVSVA